MPVDEEFDLDDYLDDIEDFPLQRSKFGVDFVGYDSARSAVETIKRIAVFEDENGAIDFAERLADKFECDAKTSEAVRYIAIEVTEFVETSEGQEVLGVVWMEVVKKI